MKSYRPPAHTSTKRTFPSACSFAWHTVNFGNYWTFNAGRSRDSPCTRYTAAAVVKASTGQRTELDLARDVRVLR